MSAKFLTKNSFNNITRTLALSIISISQPKFFLVVIKNRRINADRCWSLAIVIVRLIAPSKNILKYLKYNHINRYLSLNFTIRRHRIRGRSFIVSTLIKIFKVKF